ncbi:MAG: hypothetical protein JKY30_08940 [Flavobacteriales bacterium]|nr:hypothetical protein [Flavobacteriales bacterium]
MKVLSFEIEGWDEFIEGIVLNESEEWIEIVDNYHDLRLDGIKFVKRDHILYDFHEEDEIFKENVFRTMKQIRPSTGYVLDSNLINELKNLEIVMFELEEDDVCFIGKIIKSDSEKLQLLTMTSKAEWSDEMNIRLSDIRTISIDNEYLNTLLSYNKKMLRAV